MHFIIKLMRPKQNDVGPLLPPSFSSLFSFFLPPFLPSFLIVIKHINQIAHLKFLLFSFTVESFSGLVWLFNQLIRFICTTGGVTVSVNVAFGLIWRKLLCVSPPYTHILKGHLCDTKSTTSWTLNASVAFRVSFHTSNQDRNDQIGCVLRLMTNRERLEENNTSRKSQLFIMGPPSHRLLGKSRRPVWPPEGSICSLLICTQSQAEVGEVCWT